MTGASALAAVSIAACGATSKTSKTGDGASADAAAATQKSEAAIAASAGPDGRPDITRFCGTKPLKVALVDGFGGNGWRKIVRAEYEDEAAKCSNIEKPLYVDANGDPQKYISGVDALVAQGVDVIIGFDDFGSATLSALRRAYKKGVAVVPYNADPGGTIGKDYADFISVDDKTLIKQWVAWMASALGGKGNLLFVGGTPGNPQDTKWLGVLKEELAATPGLKLLQSTFLETKFDAASVQQAVAGALGKYPKIDGYFSSYGTAMTGAVRAYRNAGKPMVPIATVASANELGCVWAAEPKRFPLLSMDETPTLARIALRKAVAIKNGVSDDEPAGYQVQPFMDTRGGKDPRCDKGLPPDADLSSSLTSAQLEKLF
ncbi:substrate-binding domain-containing protein [Baekduia alba]|uniref:substrate-binding domain-containing protein n=1 Tax=Baekduia alba TaxID=2997333 RepID=UPI0023403F61|nr:substrate-binding domain-containing protein [Baekduia alba]